MALNPSDMNYERSVSPLVVSHSAYGIVVVNTSHVFVNQVLQ